jgi:hypothetical protein
LLRTVEEALESESNDMDGLEQLGADTPQENWPPQSHAFGCRCARCRRGDPLIERLADQTLSTALRHAQNRAEHELDLEDELGLEAATGPGKIKLPGNFGGWQGAVTLAQLFDTANPPSKLFTQTYHPSKAGFGLLYRIYEESNPVPLYIGMALKTPIRARVMSHLRGVITKAGTLAKTKQVANLQGKVAGLHQHIAQMAMAAAAASKQPVVKDPIKSEITKLRILAADPNLALSTDPKLARIKVQYGKVTTEAGYPLSAKFLHAYEAALQVLENPKSYVGSARTFEEVLEEAFEESL